MRTITWASVRSERWLAGTVLLASLALPQAHAQETVCARVKIEIKQELTLERQGFDAEMKINNTTDSSSIENVSVVVNVTDENGVPVRVSSDPNDLSAKFFVRLSSKENIGNVDGSGVVAPKSTAIMNWLLIPAPGAAGTSALGKKFLVGATLKYKFGAEDAVLEVSPDVITVKPLPLLTLDYFLTRDVVSDDPLTAQVEATEPFTLGVRVKNNGVATAKNLKIDSAQPKIIENNQGLLINFTLTGSYVNDAPAANSLLINFGDIAGNSSKMGRWNMETTLAGKFTEFTARFTHADELGGALTSILQATNAHFLLRDVKVDLPGRDQVRDFLAEDGDVIRVYESDSTDTIVSNRSAQASFDNLGGSAKYRLNFPPTDGFAYVRLNDPYAGTKVLGSIVRSDAKVLAPENVWLSKTRNEQTKKWEYFINVFDVNTTGVYEAQFDAPPVNALPPVLQFISDKTVEVGQQVSFLVEASSPNGKTVSISASALPAGATLLMQAADPTAPGLARAVFDWTPQAGSEGAHPIVFSATDGSLSAQRTAKITVEAKALPPGPGTPSTYSPMSGASNLPIVLSLQARTAALVADSTKSLQFELYADEGHTSLLESGTVAKPASTSGATAGREAMLLMWKPSVALAWHTRYFWRVRSVDGNLASPWVYATFTTDNPNPHPSVFNQTAPAPDAQVDSATPVLSWTNARVKYDEALAYNVTVYKDAALTQVAAQVNGVAQHSSGITSWKVDTALENQVRYFWRVTAVRAPALPGMGALSSSVPRAFSVNLGSPAPAAPVLAGPPAGSLVAAASATLSVTEAARDGAAPALQYVFEIDRVNTFDSDARRISPVVTGGVAQVNWNTPPLSDNGRYFWRVKARDGKLESAWTVGQFVASAANDAPAVPAIHNPGNGAWSALAQPSLEATVVTDPEGDAVRYQFEIYKDEALTQKVSDASSDNNSLIVPQSLPAKAWYWWRVRALDSQNAASAWSASAKLYVGAGGVAAQGSAIALVSPSAAAVPLTVTANGASRKVVTLRWDGVDANREPTVALYYARDRFSYGGTMIADGLRQARGSRSGSYEWDVSALAPGVYYVYASAFDNRGSAQVYAPGSVVIPNPTQSGSFKLGGPGALYEGFGTGTISISWSGASATPMLAPVVNPAYLIAPMAAITSASGSAVASYVLPFQCSKQVANFANQGVPIVSENPNFAGRATLGNQSGLIYATSNTGNEALRVCEIRVVGQSKVNDTQSDYQVVAKLSNLGTSLASAAATPVANGSGLSIVGGVLQFGAIGGGEVGTSAGVITVRAPTVNGQTLILQSALKWTVQVTR
ncbi:MAG TPA: putative Ig domain-containing protein [Telluria sp.]